MQQSYIWDMKFLSMIIRNGWLYFAGIMAGKNLCLINFYNAWKICFADFYFINKFFISFDFMELLSLFFF